MRIPCIAARILAAATLALGAAAGYAKAPARTPSTADRPFVSASAAAVTVDLGSSASEHIVGFVGSAGEAVSLGIEAVRATDPCAVDLEITTDDGRVVGSQSCAASAARVPVSLPSDGIYWARLRSRAHAGGTFAVRLDAPGQGNAPAGSDCKVAGLPLDQAKAGTWTTACASVSLSGHYALYYTIDVPTTQVVTVGLSSGTNAFLVLHQGRGTSGPVVEANDNSGLGNDARILRTLPAGTYTIEATTALPGQLGTFTLSARTDTTPCFVPLPLDKIQDGKWTTTCSSAAYVDDHPVRYYTLSVPADEEVTISLSSSTNTFLVLHQGPTQLSPILATDDNDGMGNNSMIVRTLAAGTYTIEATTALPGQYGEFTLTAATNSHPCFSGLKLNVTASTEWIARCESVYFDDHYARFYTFKVARREIVTLSLSSTTNAFLVLRQGANSTSPVIATDDNSGMGNDARIARWLDPGTYTIEATTALPGQGGTFDLTARTNTSPCFTPLPADTDTLDQWIAQCTSVSFDDHYAKYYTLVVPQDQIITLSLSSSTNAYLVLRQGDDQFGAVVAQDDNSGMGNDARIVGLLAAGTYTVEATTALPGQGGTYTISARTQTAPCINPVALDTPVTTPWIGDCTSVSFADHYALYYTLEVPQPQEVTLSLQSTTNSYLVLRQGDQLGAVVAQDDNSGMGNDARIVMPLAAGTYSIEATTALPGQGGSFTLAARSNSAPCFGTAPLDSQQSDAWVADCTSVSFDDHYAKYYTLKVPKKQFVSILLTSSTNDYLVLRSGDQLGALVAQDDNSGGANNAKIARELPAGLYTIEATTALPGQGGSFQLTIAPQ